MIYKYIYIYIYIYIQIIAQSGHLEHLQRFLQFTCLGIFNGGRSLANIVKAQPFHKDLGTLQLCQGLQVGGLGESLLGVLVLLHLFALGEDKPELRKPGVSRIDVLLLLLVAVLRPVQAAKVPHGIKCLLIGLEVREGLAEALQDMACCHVILLSANHRPLGVHDASIEGLRKLQLVLAQVLAILEHGEEPQD